MSKPYILKLISSPQCIVVAAVSFSLAYILLPVSAFTQAEAVLASAYLLLFSSSTACLVRNLKGRVMAARSMGGSVAYVVSGSLGFTALQACGGSAPTCASGLGVGVLSLVLPQYAVQVSQEYGSILLVVSIVFQAAALLHMGCFWEVKG